MTPAGVYCALCGRWLDGPAPATCPDCGAVTWYEVTDKARAWLGAREAQAAAFAAQWVAMSPQERIAWRDTVQRELERRGARK